MEYFGPGKVFVAVSTFLLLNPIPSDERMNSLPISNQELSSIGNFSFYHLFDQMR